MKEIITFFFPRTDNELQGTNSSGSLGGLDVRRRIPIKLISKQANKAKPAPRTQRTINRMPAKAPPGDEGNLSNLRGLTVFYWTSDIILFTYTYLFFFFKLTYSSFFNLFVLVSF
jgi:hypothetical protein